MTRRIELGLGDIRISCDDKHIYISKAEKGTPGKIMIEYELQDDGTCKQTVLPAFQEKAEETEDPLRIKMTDDCGHKKEYSLDQLLNIVSYSDLDRHIQRYLETLLIEDFESIEDMGVFDGGGIENNVYDYDEEIRDVLDNYNNDE